MLFVAEKKYVINDHNDSVGGAGALLLVCYIMPLAYFTVCTVLCDIV